MGFISFSTSYLSTHCLLASMVSEEKLAVNFYWGSLVCDKLLFCFPDFLFVFVFWQFDYVSQCGISLSLAFLELVHLLGYADSCISSNFFGHYFLKCTFHHFLFPSRTTNMHLLVQLLVSHILLMPYSFLFIVFYFLPLRLDNFFFLLKDSWLTMLY